ncbi:hypothetical protein [Streptomyces sulphureus]|uniref:hypothetical protein n=1 Tax=Streptomyces sulphureus TaxID=47758 RepID=UPI00036D3E57|nr:hypothetical protein [Streptomyces sulphureus]
MLPDIVIPVRERDRNEELRYTLRAIAANVPHRQVWIAGYMPSWVRDVGHVPTRQAATKYQNSRGNWKAAVDHEEVADDFLLFNDDFFVMKPLRGVMPALHRGPLSEVYRHFATRVKPGRYLLGMRQTMGLLDELGVESPLCYELHVPIALNRDRYVEVWEVCNRIKYPHSRTVYGNYWQLGGRQVRDPKVMTRGAFPGGGQFLSTMPDTFTRGRVGTFIRGAFPQRSRFEAPSGRGRPLAAGWPRPTPSTTARARVGAPKVAGASTRQRATSPPAKGRR